jgi:hypothetical protein
MSKRTRSSSVVLTVLGLGLGLLGLTAFGGRKPDDDDELDDDDRRDDKQGDDDRRDDEQGDDEQGDDDEQGNDGQRPTGPDVDPDRLWISARTCADWRVGPDYLERVALPYARELADGLDGFSFSWSSVREKATVLARIDYVIREVLTASLRETDPDAIACLATVPWHDEILAGIGDADDDTIRRTLAEIDEIQRDHPLMPLVFWLGSSWAAGGGPYPPVPRPGDRPWA